MAEAQAFLPVEPDSLDVARHRLFQAGPAALTDVELLALLCGNETPGAFARARRSLESAGGLKALLAAEFPELCERFGLGPARAAQLCAARELSRRLFRTDDVRPLLRTPEEVYHYLRPSFCGLRQEIFRVLCLNGRSALLADVQVAQGGITLCPVDPREVFHAAISVRATQVILAHNHPSGDPEPSSSDLSLTHRLVTCAKLLCIEVVDHLVFGGAAYMSFQERGLLGNRRAPSGLTCEAE